MHHDPHRTGQTPLSLWPRIVASAALLISAYALWRGVGPDLRLRKELPALLPLATLLLSAGLVHLGSFSGQLLVRATLWSALLFCAVAALVTDGGIQVNLGLLITAQALGLLVLGAPAQPAGQRGAFTPSAYGGALTGMLVMALADIQSLAFYGLNEVKDRNSVSWPLIMAGVMALAALGIYRLRLWGFLLNVAANLLVAGLALFNAGQIPRPLCAALLGTAVVQVALVLPLLLAVARRRAPATAFGASPWLRRLSAAVLLLLLLWGGYTALQGPRPWLHSDPYTALGPGMRPATAG